VYRAREIHLPVLRIPAHAPEARATCPQPSATALPAVVAPIFIKTLHLFFKNDGVIQHSSTTNTYEKASHREPLALRRRKNWSTTVQHPGANPQITASSLVLSDIQRQDMSHSCGPSSVAVPEKALISTHSKNGRVFQVISRNGASGGERHFPVGRQGECIRQFHTHGFNICLRYALEPLKKRPETIPATAFSTATSKKNHSKLWTS